MGPSLFKDLFLAHHFFELGVCLQIAVISIGDDIALIHHDYSVALFENLAMVCD